MTPIVKGKPYQSLLSTNIPSLKTGSHMSVKPPFTKGGGGLIIGQLFRAGRKLVWLGTVSTLTTTRRKKKKKKKMKDFQEQNG